MNAKNATSSKDVFSVRVGTERKKFIMSLGDSGPESLEILIEAYEREKQRTTAPINFIVSQLSEENADIYDWVKNNKPDSKMIKYSFLNGSIEDKEFYGLLCDPESPFYFENVKEAIGDMAELKNKQAELESDTEEQEHILEAMKVEATALNNSLNELRAQFEAEKNKQAAELRDKERNVQLQIQTLENKKLKLTEDYSALVLKFNTKAKEYNQTLSNLKRTQQEITELEQRLADEVKDYDALLKEQKAKDHKMYLEIVDDLNKKIQEKHLEMAKPFYPIKKHFLRRQ
jgi:DNA repair exonuclease SbcCD ATPase subunit